MQVTPALDDIAAPLAAGRYRLVEVLGSGGMATVYRTWDQRLGVFRAVKVLAPELARRPKARSRFEAEAGLMARLHHPHIVTVHDIGHDADAASGDRVWIVMELVTGGSLADVVERQGPLAPAVAAAACRDVCRALHVAHAAGVIHRDIKPHNVLLTADGVPKVSDFGIARALSREISLTRTGAVMGTWAFMAPEIRANAKQADARSDVYAVGATLYMLLTNRQPLDLHAVNVRNHLLADLPEGVRRVITRSTEYLPEDRYATAAELADDLDDLSRELAGLPALRGDTAIEDTAVQGSAPEAPDGTGPARHSTTLYPGHALPTPPRAEPAAAAWGAPPPPPAVQPATPRSPPPVHRDPTFLEEPAPQRSRGPLVGVAVAGVVLLLLGGAWWQGRDAAEAQPVADAVPTAQGSAEPPAQEPPAEPPAQEPTAEPLAAGTQDEPPAEAPALAPPPAAAPAPAASSTRRAATPPPEATAAEAPPADPPGVLKINSIPPGQVSIDGGPLLDLPLVSGVELSPGPHRLRFQGPEGLASSTTWQVTSGKTEVVCWDLREGLRCAR